MNVGQPPRLSGRFYRLIGDDRMKPPSAIRGHECGTAAPGCLDYFIGRLVTIEWVLMELLDAHSAPMAR
jgi:hypothetical protein